MYYNRRNRRRVSKATEAEATMISEVKRWLQDHRWEALTDEEQDGSNIFDLMPKDDDPALARINRWREASVDVLGTVASVVAGQSVDSEWVDGDITDIACTDGETIMYSTRWFLDHLLPAIMDGAGPRAMAMGYAELKGVTFHELCHVLYTPRKNAKPTCEIPSDHRFAYNVLEDQRIESLFTARYRPSIPFFRYIILKHIASQVDTAKGNMVHALLHGRKYIDPAVRSKARTRCADSFGDPIADRISNIIDRYRQLLFPNDWAEAVDLVAQLNEVFNEALAVPPNPTAGDETFNSNQNQTQHTHTAGKPAQIDEQRADREAMQELDEELDGGADTDGNGDSAGDSEDGDSDGDATDGDQDGSSDTGSSPDSGELHKSITDALNDAMKKMQEEGAQVARAVSRALNTVDGSDLVPKVVETIGRSQSLVTPAMRRTVSTVVDGFMRVAADCEPEYHRDQAFGALNPEAVMVSRRAHFDVFDQYDEGNDDGLSFEVVIGLDRSTSMGYGSGSYTDLAYQSMWILQRACQTIGIPVTVAGYSDGASMLSTAASTVPANQYNYWPTIGGTDATQAIQWGSTILKGSSAVHRIMFTITDGQWYYMHNNGDPIQSALEDIRNFGGKSVLLTIGAWAEVVPQEGGRWYGHDEIVKVGDDVRSLGAKISEYLLRLSAETISSDN